MAGACNFTPICITWFFQNEDTCVVGFSAILCNSATLAHCILQLILDSALDGCHRPGVSRSQAIHWMKFGPSTRGRVRVEAPIVYSFWLQSFNLWSCVGRGSDFLLLLVAIFQLVVVCVPWLRLDYKHTCKLASRWSKVRESEVHPEVLK